MALLSPQAQKQVEDEEPSQSSLTLTRVKPH